MIIVYVGDCTNYLEKTAKSFDINAKLIESTTSVEYINDGVYYTSLADLGSITTLIQVLDVADEIIYCPPVRWSDIDKNNTSKQQQWTEFYCIFFKDKKLVKGIQNINIPPNKNKMLELVDIRKSKKSQLWIAGCSISHGVGVNKDQTYGYLLSSMLNKSASFLTQPGSGIDWACDQILRSDIKQNDVVILGLTTENRFTFMDEESNILHVNTNYYSKNPEFNNVIDINVLTYNNNNIFHYVKKVHQVSNFCKKIGATLLLAGLIVDQKLIKYIFDLPNYHQFYSVNGVEPLELFLDFGTDNQHPGPKTHQWIANKIFEAINQ